ncbi:LOW QUALITY PROTEIN: hypothetical protein U0070_003944, partial [Myodes glareolus]
GILGSASPRYDLGSQTEFESRGNQPICELFWSHLRRFPEVEDVGMMDVRSIAEMGAYVSSLEYNNVKGMILETYPFYKQTDPHWKFSNECVVVIRVDTEKGYIDLSKRRFSPEEAIKCEDTFTKFKTHSSHVTEVLEYTKDEQLESLFQRTAWVFDDKYKKPGNACSLRPILDSLDLNENEQEVLISNSMRHLTPQAVKLRSDTEEACYDYEGIDAVKEVLRAGLNCSTETMPIKINLRAPFDPAMAVIKEKIEEKRGMFRRSPKWTPIQMRLNLQGSWNGLREKMRKWMEMMTQKKWKPKLKISL